MKRLTAIMVLAVLLCGTAYADTPAYDQTLQAYYALSSIYDRYQVNRYAYDDQLYLVHSYLIVFFSCDMLGKCQYNASNNENDYGESRASGYTNILKELCDNWQAYYSGSMSLSSYRSYLFGRVEAIVNNW